MAPTKMFTCEHCGSSYRSRFSLKLHTYWQHTDRTSPPPDEAGPSNQQPLVSSVDQLPIVHLKSTFKNKAQVFRLDLLRVEQTPSSKLDVLSRAMRRMLYEKALEISQTAQALKYQFKVHADFFQIADPTIKMIPPLVMVSPVRQMLIGDGYDNLVEDDFQHICTQIDDTSNKVKSGWVLDRIIRIDLDVYQFNPLRNTVGTFVPTPGELARRKCIINVRSKDNKCLFWSILAGLMHKEIPPTLNSTKPSSYSHFTGLIRDRGVNYPSELRDVKRMEKLNSGLSIHVFAFDSSQHMLYPVHTTAKKDTSTAGHVNLLILEGDKNNHFCAITNLDGLARGEKSSMSLTHCHRCLHGFQRRYMTEEKMKKHLELCNQSSANTRTVFPDEKTTHIEFKAHRQMVFNRFALYFDFECLLIPPTGEQGGGEENFIQKKRILHAHRASGYAYKIVGEGVNIPIRSYCGNEAAKHFLDSVNDDFTKIVYPEICRTEAMVFDQSAREQFGNQLACAICGRAFSDNEPVVRHHDHATGRFIGKSHNLCNIKVAEQKKYYRLNCIAHNNLKYDSKIILDGYNAKDHGELTVLGNGLETFKTIQIGKLAFKDSCQFLGYESLEKLSEKTPNFKYLKELTDSEWKLDLVKGKIAFPYTYFNDEKVFAETNIPTRHFFFNDLTQQKCPKKDYLKARQIYKSFECKNLKDYQILYNKIDVLLLTDLFEEYRKSTFAEFQIDPIYNLSLPGVSWNSFLKFTGTKIEIFKDIDFVNMITCGIRGGFSGVNARRTRANLPSLPDYDPNARMAKIVMVDCNSLYGGIMQHGKFPISDFEWIEDQQQLDLLQNNLDEFGNEEDDFSFILECDLAYPDHLKVRNDHQNFPLCPENRVITKDMLSPFYKAKFGDKRHIAQSKLLLTFYDKEKICLHIETLKYYIKKGLVLKKLHRAVKFTQTNFMQSYMDINLLKRKQAIAIGDLLQKDVSKLMNNVVFGKSLECVYKQKDIRAATNAKQFERLVAKPSFQGAKIVKEGLAFAQLNKAIIKYDKNPAIGFTILERAKLAMYRFWYDVIMPAFPSAQMNFTDTDSFCFTVYDHDNDQFYEKIAQSGKHFDFSNLKKDNPLYSNERNGDTGLWKFEIQNEILEVVALRPKLYSIQYLDEDDGETVKHKWVKNPHFFQEYTRNKSARRWKRRKVITRRRGGIDPATLTKCSSKGVKKSVQKKHLTHNQYRKCIETLDSQWVEQVTIRSFNQRLYTIQDRKIGLSANCDKRYLIDATTSVPYGLFS